MIKHRDSHIDHGLTEAQLQYVLERFAARNEFFIETITLPGELGTVPCGLYGPLMGDAPTSPSLVRHVARGDRTWSSRLVDLPPRQQYELTVIAGPHEETCSSCEGRGFYTDPAPIGSGSTLGASQTCRACEGGKIKHACILYTAFGGPATPQEPGDPGCKDVEAATKFWAEHALAAPK